MNATEKKQPDISIIIPLYNEEGAIRDTVRQIQDVVPDAEIVIVDDGSSDRSADIAETIEGVLLLRHPVNRGYGAALKTGIRAASKDIIVIIDADATYPPEEIPVLVAEIENFDMVVGARVGPQAQIPLIRRPAKWFINKYANFLVNYRIPDLNSGLRVMRKDLVERFFPILPDGFSFTTTITLAFIQSNYTLKYLPIRYEKRQGTSKIRPIKDTLNFLMLITRTTMLFNPLRVFLPIALILFLAAAGLGIYETVVQRNVTDSVTILFLASLQIGFIGMIADLIIHRSKLE